MICSSSSWGGSQTFGPHQLKRHVQGFKCPQSTTMDRLVVASFDISWEVRTSPSSRSLRSHVFCYQDLANSMWDLTVSHLMDLRAHTKFILIADIVQQQNYSMKHKLLGVSYTCTLWYWFLIATKDPPLTLAVFFSFSVFFWANFTCVATQIDYDTISNLEDL